MKPRIIIDQHIPYIAGVIEPFAEVTYLDGKNITHDACMEADCIIIRTRTICNAHLLQGTPIRLIVSATAGIDHIDSKYCAANGIAYANTKGSNAWAVVQWVVSALMLIERQSSKSIFESTVGIIGAGEIGQRLADTLELFNVKCIRNDPPREETGEKGLVDLARIGRESDIITIHTPLTTNGKHPTKHLIGNHFLHHLSKRPIIINAARGGVIDEFELLEALDYKRIRGYILDTYETEGDIPFEIIENAMLCTPHIAGYSIEGKQKATEQTLDHVAKFFGLPPLAPNLPKPTEKKKITGGYSLSDLARHYDIQADAKTLLMQPQRIDAIRNQYSYRHDWRGLAIENPKITAILQ